MLLLIVTSLIIIIVTTILLIVLNNKSKCPKCTKCPKCPKCPECPECPECPKCSSWVKQDIINLYNNSKSFDNDGLPNGGLLVSLLSNSYATGVNIGYNTTETNLDYPNNNTCYNNQINVPNLIDLNKLLLDTAKENLTNCFSLDTSYMSYDSPGILFGPLLDNGKNPGENDIPVIINMSIGLIFDINKIKKYIGCMYPADAGSVSRYNTKASTDYLNSNDLNDYDKLIRSSKGKALADAGCGLLSGQQYGSYGNYPNKTYRGGIYNEPGYGELFEGTNDKNWYPMARYTINGVEQIETPDFDGITGLDTYPIGVIIDRDYNLNNSKYTNVDIYSSPNGWFNEIKVDKAHRPITFNGKSNNINMFLTGTYGIRSQPYSRKSFKYFVDQIKNKYRNIFKVYGDKNLGKFFINTYYHNMYSLNNPYNFENTGFPNYYYENEVDIYIPNKPGTTKVAGDNVKTCNVQDDFLDVWKKCVIGIFTNHRCAEDISGSSFQIKNRNIKPNSTNTQADFNDQILSKMGSNPMLGKPECTENNPCCCSNNNYEILDKTVIELVKKWNSNNPGNPKINGYIMNDDMKIDGDTPSDFNTEHITKPLKIQQITNF